MGRKPSNPNNPLEFVRLIVGKTGKAFADEIAMGYSYYTKHVTNVPGYTDVPERVALNVLRKYGAILNYAENGVETPATGIDEQNTEVLYTKAVYETHKSRIAFKDTFSTETVLEALEIMGSLCDKINSKEKFSYSAALAVQNLIKNTRIKALLGEEMDKEISLLEKDEHRPYNPRPALMWLISATKDKKRSRRFLELSYKLVLQAQKRQVQLIKDYTDSEFDALMRDAETPSAQKPTDTKTDTKMSKTARTRRPEQA